SIRMETPVLYFYAIHPETVSVHVAFEHGWLTEWFPHATTPISKAQLNLPVVDLRANRGELFWNSIFVDPGDSQPPPHDKTPSRYYAARETAASPLSVISPRGAQHEKFLFYRGVSSSSVPISAVPMNDGRILVSNLAGNSIPQAILFERRGSHI